MAQLSDEDLKIAIRELKPRTNWGAIITTALAVAGAVWAATQYLGSTVKREELKPLQDDSFRVRIDITTINGRVERMEQSQQRVEKAVERVEGKLDDRPGRRVR